MIEKITKNFDLTYSANFQTWRFGTILTKTIEVKSAEELTAESDKLFQQVKMLTEKDFEEAKKDIIKELETRKNGEI